MNRKATEKLIQLRRINGLSQGDLARKLGLSRQAVSKWERGESCPDTENLIALARLYGVSLDELAGFEGDSLLPGRDDVEPLGDSVVVTFDDGVDEPCEFSDEEGGGCLQGVSSDEAVLPISSPPLRRHAFITAIVLLGTALFVAVGVVCYVVTEPHPRLTDAFGLTSTYIDEVNIAGVDRLVVNWPAGSVRIEAVPTRFSLSIEEHGVGIDKKANHQIKGTTLEIWSGDARAWDDMDAATHNLVIRVPQSGVDSTASTGFHEVTELVLNTDRGDVDLMGVEANVLDATMRNGRLSLSHSSFVEYRFH